MKTGMFAKKDSFNLRSTRDFSSLLKGRAPVKSFKLFKDFFLIFELMIKYTIYNVHVQQSISVFTS